MPGYLLPADDERLKETLTMIFGLEPEITSSDLDADSASHVAIYVNAEGETVATCYCDMMAAGSLACALSLIPPGLCDEMIADGTLTEVAEENLREVMNMFSSLFMNDQSDHLKLSHVVKMSDGVAEIVETSERSALSVDSGKYKSGRIAFTKKAD